LTLPILFFFVKDGEQISGWFLRQVDEQYRDDVRALSRRAWQTVAAYLRGLAVVAFFDAVVIGIGLLVIGVPLVVPLVTLTFFGGFFPIVGAVLAGLLAVLVALVNGGLVDALAVLAVVLVVQQVEGDVLAPLVLGRAVQLHPLVILLALTAGAVVAGVVGAFLAVPTAAVLVAVGAEFRARREGAEAQPDGLRRKEASWRR
ncbi:MAG: AI-2E family transporter, partial [Actinomycetota bacterium]|nr:AI-2E family transporter [Actinomycetota bacterium]